MIQTQHAIAITGQDLAAWSKILLHLGAEGLRPDAPAKQWKAAAACFFATSGDPNRKPKSPSWNTAPPNELCHNTNPHMKNLRKIPAEKLRQFVEQTIVNHAANATDPAAPPKAWQKAAVLYFQCLRDIKAASTPTRA